MAEVTFGEWLKRRRKGLGLTQGQLATRINCSTIQLKKLEAEERRPSPQIVERLAEIFNIPPHERTSFLRFARGDWAAAPILEGEEAPWRDSTASPRSNLPTSLTSFIGREPDLATLDEYLSDGGKRLITLVGPPGIGKTRLSVEAARSVLTEFPDGVFFVALAPLDDPSLIAPTIVQAIGDLDAKNQPAEQKLVDGIDGKHMLLVLDNCEHLIEDAALLVSDLLSACSRLKILATSREALRVPGEWLYPVPALGVPRDSISLDSETASSFPAVALFVERARAVRPDFVLQADNIQSVGAICERLDGLPLAIELLAARIRLMSPQALLSKLKDQFILSADGMRAVAVRQKTLFNAIRWSFNLLSTDEQNLFMGLSVFSGAFTVDAAQAIFTQARINTPVSDLIASLVDKSLLQRSPDIKGQSEPRFRMLMTLQRFALDRLRYTKNEANFRDWHLAYFLDVAEQADKSVPGHHQQQWLKRLGADHDNYRAALEWSLRAERTEAALRLLNALCWAWMEGERFNEMHNWLNKVRSLPDIQEYPAQYAGLLNYMGLVYWLSSSFDSARSLLKESQALWLGLGIHGQRGLAEALYLLGMVAHLGEADHPTAKSLYAQSQQLFKKHGEKWSIAFNWPDQDSFLDDQHPAADLLSIHPEDIPMPQQLFWDLVGRVQALGCFFLWREDYEKAQFFLEQQLRIDETLQSRQRIIVDLGNLGELQRYKGKYQPAKEYYSRSLAVSRQHNFSDMGFGFYGLGMVALHQNDFETARKRFVEYFAIVRNLGEKIHIYDFLISFAALAAGTNQPERAARLYGATQALFEIAGYQILPFDQAEFDRHLQIAREQMGDEKFAALTTKGRVMTLEQAIVYALEETANA